MGAKQICIASCRIEAGLAKHGFKAHRDTVKTEKLCSPCYLTVAFFQAGLLAEPWKYFQLSMTEII